MDDADRLVQVLTDAGYEARMDRGWKPEGGRVHVTVQALSIDASIEDQRAFHTRVRELVESSGIAAESTGSGVGVGGGTPYHRWLRVTLDGVPTDTKVLAADDNDVEKQLEGLVDLGVERSRLDVIRPDPWPAIPDEDWR